MIQLWRTWYGPVVLGAVAGPVFAFVIAGAIGFFLALLTLGFGEWSPGSWFYRATRDASFALCSLPGLPLRLLGRFAPAPDTALEVAVVVGGWLLLGAAAGVVWTCVRSLRQ